jgi:hypothetical protein
MDTVMDRRIDASAGFPTGNIGEIHPTSHGDVR